MTARDVIALQLKGDMPDTRRVERAQNIVTALHMAGYVIVKDRTDPEGGIPGRT
jgi:hypothetical protein